MSLSLGKALAFFTTPAQVNSLINDALATRGITIDAANYTALVTNYPAATHNGDFAWVEAAQGTAWLPGTMGGTYYPLGLYHSNGTDWVFTPSPSQATQAEVDTGTNNDKFVTPNTFNNSSQLASKEVLANKATTFTGNTSSDTKYPSVKATADYIAASVSTGTVTSTNGGNGSTSAVTITGANGYGGANYLGAVTLNNTGATNGKKFLRINATGALEVVNDAYSAVIFTLTNSGDVSASNLNVSSTISAYGLQTTVISAGTINATTIVSGTPAAAKSSYNVALGTTVGVDNYTFRIANDGGIFPQVQSASFIDSIDSCWSFFASVTGNATITAQNSGTLVPTNSWVTLFGNHGMDSRGDTVVVHITDKNAGKIYRVTFLVTNNSSNTTGYNIVIERII